MQTLGERLKEERKKRGITQSAMAEILGLTRSAYSLYESGRREPNITTLKNIAATLNTTTDNLLGESLLFEELSEVIEKQEIVFNKLSDKNTTQEEAKKLISELRTLIDKEDFLDRRNDFLTHREQTSISCRENQKKILTAFDLLNISGQNKAIEQVEMLTKIPEYQKSPDK